MDDTDLFVLGVVNSYATVNNDVFEEIFDLERDEDRYLDLDGATLDDVHSSIRNLRGRGIIERDHRSYQITDLGEQYASDFTGWPTASGFLSKYRIASVGLVLGIVVAWIIALPFSTDACRTISFPDAFTCGLPLVILPLLLISGAILSGHGWRVGKETAAFIGSNIRYSSRSRLDESTYKNAVYSRLAYAVPAETIAAAAIFVLLILVFDVYVMSGRLNNQIYGLTFDGFGGYLLAKSEFLRGKLRLSSGSDLQTESGSDEVHNIFDGAFGFSLLILGFSLQFAAIFPVVQLSNLIWGLGDAILNHLS